jgi:hypothetical protein
MTGGVSKLDAKKITGSKRLSESIFEFDDNLLKDHIVMYN